MERAEIYTENDVCTVRGTVLCECFQIIKTKFLKNVTCWLDTRMIRVSAVGVICGVLCLALPLPSGHISAMGLQVLSTEAVSLVPNHIKKTRRKAYGLTAFLWLAIFEKCHMSDAFLMTLHGFYLYWNRKNLPVLYMISQVIYILVKCKQSWNLIIFSKTYPKWNIAMIKYKN